MAGRVLIVSPIPSEPQDQGNSVRIAVMGKMLQSAGLIVHFLYHKLEGLTLTQHVKMAACWDHLHIMDGPPRPPVRAKDRPNALDDWYDPALTDFAYALHKRWHFRAVVVNYVWCSGVFEAFERNVIRILDTHDVFGGRDARLNEMGLAPNWYYTTPDEEAKGLLRADIVLAIQEDEERIFRESGHSDVRTVGHLLPVQRRNARARGAAPTSRPLVGYLASGNPLNVRTFVQLQVALRKRADAIADYRWLLAGTICNKVDDFGPFDVLGEIENTGEFYDNVDLVLNPMDGGTGLKIKSVEAIHRGVPLIATQSAMAGLPATHPAHCLGTADDVADYLLNNHLSDDMLNELSIASECCAVSYAESVRLSYCRLLFDLGVG
jgi:polysaccharide biosynthesis protein PslH